MSTRITVKMQPINRIVTRLGVDKQGDVQMQLTRIINKRITRYMPYRSSALSTKLKVIKSPTEIEVMAPYARYQYYGKVMIGPPPKTVTNIDLSYEGSKTKHPLAGPYWDKHMMANEGMAIRAEIQRYVGRRGKK